MLFRFYSKPTVASRVTVVGEHHDNKLDIAVARCSESEQFIRAKGRAIAEQRLEENKLYVSIPLSDCNVATFAYIAKGIANEVLTSKKVYNEN